MLHFSSDSTPLNVFPNDFFLFEKLMALYPTWIFLDTHSIAYIDSCLRE